MSRFQISYLRRLRVGIFLEKICRLRIPGLCIAMRSAQMGIAGGDEDHFTSLPGSTGFWGVMTAMVPSAPSAERIMP